MPLMSVEQLDRPPKRHLIAEVQERPVILVPYVLARKCNGARVKGIVNDRRHKKILGPDDEPNLVPQRASDLRQDSSAI
jgi:hypothetical protein